MKKYIILLSFSILIFIAGVILEKYKYLSFIYTDYYMSPKEIIYYHNCDCISKNPESYNFLLDEVETINLQLKRETSDFTATKGLETIDFRSYIILLKNGDFEVTILCSSRTPAVNKLAEEYSETIVNKYIDRLHKAVNIQHEKNKSKNKR